MSGLACWSCGRQLYTVAPLESLFAEERRCPRCGAFLHNERRAQDRRTAVRRQDQAATPPDGNDRRDHDRREIRRRRPSDGTGAPYADEALRRTG